MQDRRVVVVTNMKTRKLRGEPSMGMILAAEKDINEKLTYHTSKKLHYW